jgi:hypothetical protein
MANPYDLTTDPPRTDDARRRLLAADAFPPLAPPSLDLGPRAGPAIPWSPDDELRREMARLEAGYPAVSPSGFGPTPLPTSEPGGYAPLAAAFTSSSAHSVATLKAENEEMHKLIEEMKLIFQQATAQEEASAKTIAELQTKAADLDRQVQERDDQVTLLTGQIAELEKHIQELPTAPPPPPSEDELAKLADELEKERCTLAQDRKALEQERQQLKEDEEALMAQMREMEVQMAKERAELARQRTDLQRLHAEVRQELEQLQRGDGALRERLVQFQRRHQAVFDRNGGANQEPAPEAPVAPTETNAKENSGFVKRLFKRS